MKDEPVLTAAGIAALIAAVLILLSRFGVPLSSDQQQAIIAVVALAVPLVAAVVARSKVVPVAKLEEVPSGAQALHQIETKNAAAHG
jgi:hypothetical protein